jgi:integrase
MAKDRSGYVGKDKNGRWFARVTVTDSTGKRRNIARRTKDKTEAKQVLRAILRQIENEGEKALEGSQLTFNDLCDYYQRTYLHAAEYVKEKKVSGLRSLDRAQVAVKIFRAHFGSRKLRGITYGDIFAFRSLRLRTPTPHGKQRAIATVNRELVVMRRILNVGVQQGWLTKSPFGAGKSLISAADEEKRERILSREEEARLLAAIDAEPQREHLKGILLMALDCALRRGEILKLKWAEVDLDRRTITVRAFNAKTAKSRTVAMTTRVYADLLQRWQSSAGNSDKLVFGIKSQIRTAFVKACRDAKISDFRFHDCRHTAISRMIRAGLPLVEVMRVSGHQTLSCLYRYANLDSDAVFRAAAALDAFHAAQASKSLETTEAIN